MERRIELISEMTPAIWLHVLAAIAALVLGAFVLWRRKGDVSHKFWGRIWVGLMLIVAISSFFIKEIRDGFSPIHALSVYTLCSLAFGIGVFWVRPKQAAIRAHQASMRSLYVLGLLVTGGFTFLPHRLMGRLVSEATMVPQLMLIGAAMVGGIVIMRRTFRHSV